LNSIPPDTNPPLRLLMATQQTFGQPQPEWMVQAPGRDMWIAAFLKDGHEFVVHSADADASVRFSHRSAKTGRTVLKRPLPDWVRYPAGVITSLGDAGLSVPGFHAVVLGNEPSGPRYNFGLGLVFAAFCYAVSQTNYTEDELVEVVEQVRRDYIGE
jgi:galactokinase